MDAKFLDHVQALGPKLDQLRDMPPVNPAQLPGDMPKQGVYAFSEGGDHLYVGRSKNIRGRVQGHSRPSSTHGVAAFAFRLAREATGNLRASYRKGEGSRADLMEDPVFTKAFEEAKDRVRKMDLRFVEETDPVRQTLLEIYVAVALDARHNNFDTH